MLILSASLLIACSEETVETQASGDNYSAEMDQFVQDMHDTFEGHFEIEFIGDTNTHEFTVIDSDLSSEILLILNGRMDISIWNEFTDSFSRTSELLSDVSGESHSITILNPANNDKVIYSAMNGVTIYDAME